MYQAIITKFIGPTNFRGSRVKASADAGSMTVNWDHALNHEQNHDRAAQALAEKLQWGGKWYGGGLLTGNVYVCTGRHEPACVAFRIAFEHERVAA